MLSEAPLMSEAFFAVAGDEQCRDGVIRDAVSHRGTRHGVECGASDPERVVECVVRVERGSRLGREATAAAGPEGMVVEGRAAVAFKLLRLRLHDREHTLRPVLPGESRIRVREDLRDDAIRVV